MYPDPVMEALLFELAERRSQVAMHRQARSCNRIEARHAQTLRWAVGDALLRLGNLVSKHAGASEARQLLTQDGHK